MEEDRKNNKRWYFTREQLENSPSRRFGLDSDKELSYRQQAANLLQEMGQRLNVYPCGLGLRPWSQSYFALLFRPRAVSGTVAGRGRAGTGCLGRRIYGGEGWGSVFARAWRGGVNFPLAHRGHQPFREFISFQALCINQPFRGPFRCVLIFCFGDFEILRFYYA